MSGHVALPNDTLRVVEIHYFRVPRHRWELMVLRARQSGANAVSSYIPWIHHAPSPGNVDLTGGSLAERDLVGFVELCASAGLGFIAKPGPFCDSEMLGGGVPTWLIDAHPDWWARRHDGEPYRHSDSNDPRLSYDHPEAQAAAAVWLRSVATALEPFAGKNLWAVQIDNETPGDGMWIHEDGLAPSPIRADVASPPRWQAFLSERYGTVAALNEAWESDHPSFDEVALPTKWEPPDTLAGMRRWLDLDRFADTQMASGLGAYAAAITSVLGDRVPLFHDWLCMPWPLAGMLVEPGVLADTCGWVGQNVYAEGVDPTDMIAGTNWYRMNDDEYVHHAWWRTRLCHTLSPAGMPNLVPEISARQAFYLQCSLIGGMDAPCIYMLHSSEPEPDGIGAFERWAEEAPVLPDGNVFGWWWNLRTLFVCLEAGGADLVAAPLNARVAIAYDHAGERAARWAGVIDGAGFPDGSAVGELCAAANSSAAGQVVARQLVDAGVVFDVVDVTRCELDHYEVVLVPPMPIMSRTAAAALTSTTADVRWVGLVPTLDEDLNPLTINVDAVLSDPLAGTPPTADAIDTPGVDRAVRVGPSGRRYVTIANRTHQPWVGTVADHTVTAGAASVTWMAVDTDGAVVAAMVHGDDAVAGPITCSQGQCAVALLGSGDAAAWHVVSQERAWVGIADAAGEPLWRVTLSGKVLNAGTVGPDGRFRFVANDDAGQTDRYVIGDQRAADAVAGAVNDYFVTTLTRAEQEANALGVSVHEVTDRIRRIRSSLVAGTATDEDRQLLASLTTIAARMNDIRLGES